MPLAVPGAGHGAQGLQGVRGGLGLQVVAQVQFHQGLAEPWILGTAGDGGAQGLPGRGDPAGALLQVAPFQARLGVVRARGGGLGQAGAGLVGPAQGGQGPGQPAQGQEMAGLGLEHRLQVLEGGVMPALLLAGHGHGGAHRMGNPPAQPQDRRPRRQGGFPPASDLRLDHEVEVAVRIIGVLRRLPFRQVQVIGRFCLLPVQVELSVMVDHGVQPADPQPLAPEAGFQDFVDPAFEAQAREPADQPQHRLVRVEGQARAFIIGTGIGHHRLVEQPRRGVPGIVAGDQGEAGEPGLVQDRPDRPVVPGRHRLVGVEEQHPVAGAQVQAGIAGGGEVVPPGEVADPGPVRLGHGQGAVGGARVHHHQFVHQAAHRSQAAPQGGLLVAHDHGEGKGGHRGMIAPGRKPVRADPDRESPPGP